METGKSEGNYTVEQMQQMATVAQTADGLEISGKNFKVTALTGCPDMVLFACEQLDETQQELLHTQHELSQIQDLLGHVSFFIENLDEGNLIERDKAFNVCLEIGNKIRNLNLPEFIKK